MAHAYTPGLKVTERTVVRKARRLPLKGNVVRALGERVKATDVVARTELPGKIYPINVASVLGVGPEQLQGLMKKQAGATVQKDEKVAETPGFLGLFKSEWLAPVSGTIESISRVTGQVILQEAPIPVEVNAYINGEVVELLPDEGVVVESEALFVQGIRPGRRSIRPAQAGGHGARAAPGRAAYDPGAEGLYHPGRCFLYPGRLTQSH